jgi:GntR family transcriptional regulator
MSRQILAEALVVNYRPRVPRYLQIAETLRRDLRGEGERIESEHQLCARFNVSRPTIRQALDVLVQEGLLYRHAGRGTFSTPSGEGERRLRVIGSLGDMIALGDETWFKIVSREKLRLPPNIAQALRLPPGSLAYQIVGVRHADAGPFQHVTTYVPPAIGRALENEDLSKTSILATIERHVGVPVKYMEQVVDAALAPRRVAELLQIRPRSPILCFERTYFAVGGEAIEYAITYQACRRYPYRVTFSQPERAERRS